MTAPPLLKPGHISEALSFLRAIAANTERIADALEAANQNDPIAAINRAMADEPKPDPNYVQPPEWMTR